MSSLLKFITCGSVDDGKSTLIGHMLYDAKLVFVDQVKALELDSRLGSREGKLDYSLLLDGLMDEREQGITIDVAYRFFTTPRRSFIVADCPGHEQYTRNMAVGASFASLAVVLADATKGLLIQTKRHARICAMMGIRHFVLAVNKMDLVDYDESVFDEMKAEFFGYVSGLGGEIETIHAIPVSATEGDNITARSAHTPWYTSAALLSYLEEIDTDRKDGALGFVMPVQRVCRPNLNFRGFQGQIEHGSVNVGDEITILPSREKATVDSIYVANKQADEARSGDPVTICLNREVDVSRGNVLTTSNQLDAANIFTATLLWMDDADLVPGRGYFLKCGTKTLPATVMTIKHKIDVNTGKHIQADKLMKNEIAVCDISNTENIVFAPFAKSVAMGGFILIDRVTDATSACGMISHSLRRSANVVWQDTDITPDMRAAQKNQKPNTVWFTGLSGAGKSFLANALEKRLFAAGKHTMLLDGDNVRFGLNRDLGFNEANRVENIRRVSEVAKLMNDAGLIVLVSFISPYESDRQNAKAIIGDAFKLVYVSTPIEVCESRDVKGLYKKARHGEIPNFTGVTAPYEAPREPDFTIDTSKISLEEAVENIYKIMEDERNGF